MRLDVALLALRLVVGIAFVLHGLPKIEHPTSWATHTLPDLPGWLAALAAVAEFGGGIGIAAGLLTRVWAALIACNMLVAIFLVAIPKGEEFVNNTPGTATFESALVYLVIALAFLLVGAGDLSFDALIAKASIARTRPRITGQVRG